MRFAQNAIFSQTRSYVLVIAPLRGMLLVYKYKPDTQGRAAPEGGGLINRNIPSEGAISDLQPVAYVVDVKAWGVVASHAPSCWLRSVQAARGRT